MITELSLFSGYCGITLGLKLAGLDIRTVAYCEHDKYCQEIIRQRVRDGYLNDAPIWPDVRSLDGFGFNGCVDIVTAGFPCQPHSHAGRKRGAQDERNLWPDTLRVVGEVRPRWILLENVRGICDGKDPFAAKVVGQLSQTGYDCEWGIVSASQAGAPHRRDRWWCLAVEHSQRNGPHGLQESRSTGVRRDYSKEREEVAYSQHTRLQRSTRTRVLGTWGTSEQPASSSQDVHDSLLRRHRTPEGEIQTGRHCSFDPSWWAVEPDVGRVANGVASRVDQLKALGNGVVPAVVVEFLRRIDL